jgi:Ca2+-binding RTX toxin-like protein
MHHFSNVVKLFPNKPIEPVYVLSDEGLPLSFGPSAEAGNVSHAGAGHSGSDEDQTSPSASQPTSQPTSQPVVQKPNHAPVKSRPVYLTDSVTSDILLITVASLLAFTTDIDGDTLTVNNLQVSSGQLLLAPEGYLYIPDPDVIGPVQISYEISDGEFSLTQTAHFTVEAVTPAAADLTGVILGSEAEDLIDASETSDVIIAMAGADHVQGHGGDDVISGGAGDDAIYGGAGDDTIFGEDGNDLLQGDAGNDHLFGGAGNDSLDGGTGDDALSGGAGDDLLQDSAGADMISGDSGSDTVIAALDGADDVFSGGSRQPAEAVSLNAAVNLTTGADPSGVSEHGVDITERDTIDYSAATLSLNIDLIAGTVEGAEVGSDSIDGFEVVIAGSGDDTFLLGTTDGILTGGDGDDRFNFTATQTLANTHVSIFQILDFRPGDVVETQKYHFFEAANTQEPSTLDAPDPEIATAATLSKVRVTFEKNDDEDQTVIALDGDDDLLAGLITVNGHHFLIYHELT